VVGDEALKRGSFCFAFGHRVFFFVAGFVAGFVGGFVAGFGGFRKASTSSAAFCSASGLACAGSK